MGASRTVASCTVMGELGWRKMTERSEDQMIRYLGRLRRMDETRLTKMYEVSIAEDLPWWKEMKQVLRKYVDEEDWRWMRTPAFQTERQGGGNVSIEEVQSKKTLDLYAAVKKQLKEEKYVNDPGDRRGARLKFRFRTRSAGLRAEVGGWKNKGEARQCAMCSKGEESVEHVLLHEMYTAYRSESGS